MVFQDHVTKTKIIIYSLSQLMAMATKLSRVVINLKAAFSDLRQFLVILWSCDKSNTLYLHLQRWSCDHVTNQIHYISTCRRLMKLQIRHGADLPWEAPTLDQREVTWHLKNLKTLSFENFKTPLSHDFWPLNLAECWLWGGDSTRERLHCHLLLYFLENLNFLIRVFW